MQTTHYCHSCFLIFFENYPCLCEIYKTHYLADYLEGSSKWCYLCSSESKLCHHTWHLLWHSQSNDGLTPQENQHLLPYWTWCELNWERKDKAFRQHPCNSCCKNTSGLAFRHEVTFGSVAYQAPATTDTAHWFRRWSLPWPDRILSLYFEAAAFP